MLFFFIISELPEKEKQNPIFFITHIKNPRNQAENHLIPGICG